jgi:hypothetical protein
MNESRTHNPTPPDALKAFDRTSRANRYNHILMDNVDVLGVVGGVKSLALVMNRPNLLPLLSDMNLHAHTIDPKNDRFHMPVVAVAKHPDVIDELVATSQLSDEEEHRTVGRLLGFPETATDYFLRRFDTIGTPDELPMIIPDWIDGTVDEQLHSFILSPEQYQEEMAAYIDPLHDAVRTFGPETYRGLEKRARAVRRQKTAQRVLSVLGKDVNSREPYVMQRVTKR